MGEPAKGRAMKAIVQHGYGAPQDVLRLAEVEMPAIGAEDVLVSVRASSANPWDWHFIRGEPVLPRRLPRTVLQPRQASVPPHGLSVICRKMRASG